MSIVITGNPGVGKHTIANEIANRLELQIVDINKIKKMIVLRRNPYDLISVYKKREYSDKKIRENTCSEILGIIAHDAINQFGVKVFQVDVTTKNVLEVINKVMSIINGEDSSEDVDWLDLVAKHDDLKKFFAY